VDHDLGESLIPLLSALDAALTRLSSDFESRVAWLKLG
jgi:hypothetical protein